MMSKAVSFQCSPSKTGNDSIFDCIKNAIRSADAAVLAVAFIGDKACEKLGLDNEVTIRGKTIEIYCDLASGACNPNEVRNMIDDLKIPVFSVAKLHAKVVWTSECVT
jgi:hypothetical protein